MKKLFLFIISIYVVCTAKAQKDADTQIAIIREIGQVSAKIKSMECDFVQTKYISMLNEKMVSKGKMHFQQPNKLRWEYLTPYTYTFIINADKVKIENNNRVDIIDTNQNKVFKEISRIMMTSILGTCLSDDKLFKVSMMSATTPNHEYVATLIPKRKELKQTWDRLVLHFDIEKKLVSEVEMYEKNGDRTVIEIQHGITNGVIPPDLFKID